MPCRAHVLNRVVPCRAAYLIVSCRAGLFNCLTRVMPRRARLVNRVGPCRFLIMLGRADPFTYLCIAIS